MENNKFCINTSLDSFINTTAKEPNEVLKSIPFEKCQDDVVSYKGSFPKIQFRNANKKN